MSGVWVWIEHSNGAIKQISLEALGAARKVADGLGQSLTALVLGHNVSGVADAASFTVMGTPNCGKGELNQVIGTGHASPACKFSDIEVFGGEE